MALERGVGISYTGKIALLGLSFGTLKLLHEISIYLYPTETVFNHDI